jgi:hypothetical protein
MSTPKKKQRAKTTQDNPGGGGTAGTGNQNWTKRAPQSNAKTEHDQEGSAILTCLSALKYLTADQRGRVITYVSQRFSITGEAGAQEQQTGYQGQGQQNYPQPMAAAAGAR